jgi:SAM-dependent methyltransferase
VCPLDHGRLGPEGAALVCESGHSYSCPDGIPVLVVDRLPPSQPNYWATDEQIERVRLEIPPRVEGEGVDPYVEQLIVGTHGNLYRHVAAGQKLSRYPIPTLRVPSGTGTFLDIGCNWGRWSIAAAQLGYRVTGLDPSFEPLVAARRIARQLRQEIRFVAGDGRLLPFADESFDVVFSYSVLQHLSRDDVREAVREIGRVLRRGGTAWIQMPNAFGVRNVQKQALRRFRDGTGFDVRYWTPAALRRTFSGIGPVTLLADGYLALNPQASDVDLLPPRYRLIVRLSEGMRRSAGVFPPLVLAADSVFVRVAKP